MIIVAGNSDEAPLTGLAEVPNTARADTATQPRRTPAAYHGAVMWSWQQALFAAGLERQLARADLPAATG